MGPSTLLSVILPTFNEAENIAPLIRAILDASGAGVEVIVVDDSSPDGTADVVRREFGADGRVRLIIRETDRGLAKSIRRGLEEARGHHLLVMDTDFNHDPRVIPVMRDLLGYYDLVVGSRFVFGGGMQDGFRYYCSSLYNLAIRIVLGTRIQDNLCGFFAMRRAWMDRLPLDAIFFGYGDYFFRLLHQAVGLGLSMIEIPVFYKLRPAGQSKTKFLSIFSGYTAALFKYLVRIGLHRTLPTVQGRIPSTAGLEPAGSSSSANAPEFIRVSGPAFAQEDTDRLAEAVRRNEIAKGSFSAEAEAALALATGMPHIRLVSNGTAACHLCMLAVNVRPGDKVGVPAFTYVATANAVRYQQAQPVFVDVRRDRPVLDGSCLPELARQGAVGLWAVHLYGKVVADLSELVEETSRRGLWVAEDAAQALGCRVNGRPVGASGIVSAFSFFANKNVTSGEGGAVASRNREVHDRVYLLSNQGVLTAGSYDHLETGYNYRLTNLQAALLVGQFRRLEEIVARKREIQRWYEERLKGSPLGGMLKMDQNEVPWLCSLLAADENSADRIRKSLTQARIEFRSAFVPIPALKPYGAMREAELAERFPNAYYWSRHLISLPSALSLSETQVDRVAMALKAA
ncbi:MAG: DegT/DnrJ/EryC1/StrS family aminotransferase [Nitrospirae bacterium]|nr:DegT/DnrJ/EryC1/StrS family aminotransferase [Nitrospirota bacterium]